MTQLIPILLSLLLCLGLSHAIPQNEIFQVDWQTVQTGKPISNLLSISSNIVSISDCGILSLLDSTNGDVLYRYQFPIQSNNSKLYSLDNDKFISVLNAQQSLVSFWNIENNVFFIENELVFDKPIIGMYKDFILFEDLSISIISNDFSVNTIPSSNQQQQRFIDSLISPQIDNSLYIQVKSSDNSIKYFNFANDQLSSTTQLKQCLNSETLNCESQYGSIISKDFGTANELSNLPKELIKSIPYPVSGYKIIDDQFFALFTNSSVYLFDSDSFSVPMYDFSYTLSSSSSNYHVLIPDTSDLSSAQIISINDSDLTVNFHSQQTQWIRDESQAYIIDSLLIDLNEKPEFSLDELKEEEHTSNILLAYINRLKRNYNLIFGDKSNQTINFNQHFGYEKNLIVLTKNGKIISYDTLKKTEGDQLNWIISTNLTNLVRLYHVQNRVFVLDEREILHEIDITNKKLIKVHPRTIANHFKILNFNDERIIKLTDSESFYSLKLSTDKKLLEGTHYENELESNTWKHTLGNDESFLSITTRSYGNDKVASRGIEITDRKVLYKYLLPNLAIVTTYNTFSQSLQIKLVNIIHGEIYQTFSKLTTKPESLNLIYEENFIIFTLDDEDKPNTLVTAIDLFESLTPDLKQITNETLTSNIAYPPTYEMKTFILPSRKITTLAISQTINNVSNKLVLFQTTLGELLSFPKFVINGRRPVTKDKSTQRFLPNYDPILGINDKYQLSHYRKLITSSTAKIISRSTNLESTSVIVSIGVDIFVSMVKPSGGFDVMDLDEFNKPALLGTIIVLFFGIWYTGPKVQQKKLNDSWIIGS